jgi:hypothetical protein
MSKKVDGRKRNAGRHLIKAEGQKKRPVTIYAVNDDIELVGGLDNSRKLLKNVWELVTAAKSAGLDVLDIRIKI